MQQDLPGKPRRETGDTAQSVIDFWRDAGPERWFRKDAAFDGLFRERFMTLHFAAARRELDAWAGTAAGSLALAILLDQFPRNSFRGTAHMYATDPLARHFARLAQARGHGAATEPALRLFLHLPFCHSEDLADQGRGGGACRRPPRGDPPLRALPASQRPARAGDHAGGGHLPGGGRLRGLRAVSPSGSDRRPRPPPAPRRSRP